MVEFIFPKYYRQVGCTQESTAINQIKANKLYSDTSSFSRFYKSLERGKY